ncbi:MAG TPA: hypothetical protein VFI62_16585, partial [Burkholderiales bacterium]|nr:hypothetical protein [Burkholderiales bacterium]
MSVINQMLQDLDKRRVQPSGALAAANEVRVLTPSPSPRARTVKPVAIVIAIIIAAAMLTWGALYYKASSRPSVSVQDILGAPLAASAEITSR